MPEALKLGDPIRFPYRPLPSRPLPAVLLRALETRTHAADSWRLSPIGKVMLTNIAAWFLAGAFVAFLLWSRHHR